MPLSSVQIRVLGLIARHRNPESYVAGAAPLARTGPRFSSDIDVFHDRELALQHAVTADVSVLAGHGFVIEWIRRLPALCTATVRADDGATLLEWAVDSAYRFFPAIRDDLFGYVLHAADIATNKALAAAGRREPRDLVDLLMIHRRYLPLGAVVWAACAKDPGFSPEGIIAEIRRNGRYQQADFDRVLSARIIDAAATSRDIRAALDEADAFVRAMPAGDEGLLYLGTDGRPVQPDPAALAGLVAHGGRHRGHWPSSPQIDRAMMERHDPGFPQ